MKEFDQLNKDIDAVFNQMDQVFKEVDKTFKTMEQVMDDAFKGQVARKREVGPWKEWYAWRPVKVKDKRVWLKKVYRRVINTYVDQEDWTRYEYGTIFDVLKEESK